MEHPLERADYKSGEGEKSVPRKTSMTEVVVIRKKTAKVTVYMCRQNIIKFRYIKNYNLFFYFLFDLENSLI